MEPWTEGQGAYILEAWQDLFYRRWVQIELDKGQLRDWQRMRSLGRSQGQVLDALFTAVETSHRLDLSRFCLQTGVDLLTESASAQRWVENLVAPGIRLEDRTEGYKAALAFVRRFARLAQWQQEAQATGYLDEGYKRAQLWKADWERWHGEALASRAQAIVRQLDPLN